MKFDKKYLKGLLWKGIASKECRIIEEKIIGKSRWSIKYNLVFEKDGTLYQTRYSEGATELQAEKPFDYADDEIECQEVQPVEKIIIVYEPVK